MWLLLLPVCLALFSSSFTSASEPHYVITVPTNLEQGSEEKACVTFLDLKGEVDLKLELKHEDQVHNLGEHKVNTPDHSECYTFQVPKIEENLSVWHFHVSAHGENLNVDDSKKVVITKGDDMCEIMNDKSTYKPGEIVKFRLLTLNHDLKATSKTYPLVEIIDPNTNRIAQWLDVSTKDGFAEFSFHLGNELALGSYRINLPNHCSKDFTVAEYVLKRFEVNINTPSKVALTDKTFHLEACGSYIYGKPVEGHIDLSVCPQSWSYEWFPRDYDFSAKEDQDNCITVNGEKTDSKGCVSRDIQIDALKFSGMAVHKSLQINVKLTEDGTGHIETASAPVDLNAAKKNIEFVECQDYYQKGFLYHGTIKVTDEKDQLVANEDVTIKISDIEEENDDKASLEKVVTDSHGMAHFVLNTSTWRSVMRLKALPSSADPEEEDRVSYFDRTSQIYLGPLHSKSESSLSIPKNSEDVSCNSEQSVVVQYDIHKKNLDSDTDHLHFFYILLSKSGIFSYKEHKVDLKEPANLHGSFPLNFHVDEEFFPRFSLLVFSVLPNGELVVATTDYNVSPCAQSKVNLRFSKEQVRPGENVDLEVTAEAGSLCSVRSVDKGYFGENRYHDAMDVESSIRRFRGIINNYGHTHLAIDRPVHECPENTSANTDWVFDAYSLFLRKNIQIFTNTKIRAPVTCVPNDLPGRSSSTMRRTMQKGTDNQFLKRYTRKYFPDTWLYELVTVGSDGHTVLNRTTPDSITKWMTDAFCLGKSGLSSVKDVELTAFQPYFIDLIVPYSVVQGEKFTIQAMVFSYVENCLQIGVHLPDTEDLAFEKDREHGRCVCDGHSHTFSWEATALKPKELKIHVFSGAIERKGGCTRDLPHMVDGTRTDFVEKTILVKPKGYEDQKTETFLLFPSDNREAVAININAPERLVAGSERAHLIIQGDIMANVVINLENIIYMPDGCGEQNIAKFSRYVNTLGYLENVEELTPKIKARATEALVEGYQKQLTFRKPSGAYVLFQGEPENLWITALVVKAYSGAQKYIYVDESHMDQSINWLHSQQMPNGCFRKEGDYFNNELESENDVTRTAFVAVALLEHHVKHNGTIVEDALSCLRKSVDNATSVYSQALLAYAFTLSGDSELRDQILKKLEEKAEKKDGMTHWEADSYWDGETVTAAYVILALLSDKTTTRKDLEESGDIARWIVKRQNAWGGFSSSQDTDIGLQALAKYAKATDHKRGDATVTIKSKSGFEKIVHVDKTNSLLVQQVNLPEIPGEYTVSATGDGFVYLQSHLHYNVMPERTEKGPFSFNVTAEPSACTRASQKKFEVHVDVRYTGKRESTNMALIIVEPVSGYVFDKDSVKKLEKNPLVGRTEITAQNVSIYLTKLTHETESFVFSLEQEAHVENLQPATAVVLDYYNPEEYTVDEYNAPCSSFAASCAVRADEREDCGFPGVTREQCEQKGCCYDSSTPGTRWCFFQGFKKIEEH